MTSNRRPPRAYAPTPGKFGQHGARRSWSTLPADPVERSRSRAAQVQDTAVGHVLAGLKAGRYKRADLLDRTGWGRERLSRLMNGNTPAGLDDLMLLLEAAQVPFSAVAWPATDEQHRERQRLTDVRDYLAKAQQQAQEDIARIERAHRAT
jgi:transcriptional regulator with XRE-family HTH domain